MAFGAAKPFSFGGASTSSPAPAATASSAPKFSFGNSSSTSNTTGTAAAPATFSFGNSTTTQQNASTPAPFGGFGLGSSTQQQQQPAATSNLFGGFGSSTTNNTNNNAAGGGSLGFSFGAQNQQNQNQQQQQQQPALSFGNISKPPLTVSQLFPSSSNTGLNQSGAGSAFSLGASSSQAQPLSLTSSTMLGQSTSNNNPANDAQILAERISAITNAWNPSSFDNKFLFYLYNVADVPLSTPLSSLPLPPQVAASPRLASLYKQAVLESPRPKDYLPVLASSFDDLQKRVEIQKTTSQAHLAKLKSQDVKGKIDQANKKHWNETLVRIERLSREQVKLEERLVRMCAKLAGLHPSSSSASSSSSSGAASGSGSTKDDGELLIMLEHIRNELNGHTTLHRNGSNSMKQISRPIGNTNRLANIVSELWMVVSQRKAALANNQRSGTPDNYGEYRVQDQGELNRVLEVLAQQQKSLDYLSKAIRILCVDIDTARNGFGLPWMFNDASEGSRGMVMG